MNKQTGKQNKVSGGEHHVGFAKLLSGGGAKKNYDGISMSGGKKAAEGGKLESRWQGTTKGKTTHK